MVICKIIWIPDSRTLLLLESKILGFGIRNTAQGIRNPTDDWNPESSSTDKGPESSTWESGIPLTIGIQNPSSTNKDWNPVPGIQNTPRGIQNPIWGEIYRGTSIERTVKGLTKYVRYNEVALYLGLSRFCSEKAKTLLRNMSKSCSKVAQN